MPIVLNKQEALARQDELVQAIYAGKIIIYPTDTVYGLGCNAQDAEAVERLCRIKGRENKPMSVAAPSFDWIEQHCDPGPHFELIKQKLPGPYTFILNLKDKSAIAPLVNNHQDNLGVRMFSNWWQGLVTQSNVPFVTTSVNQAGQPSAKQQANIDPTIHQAIDILVVDDQSHVQESQVLLATSTNLKVLR